VETLADKAAGIPARAILVATVGVVAVLTTALRVKYKVAAGFAPAVALISRTQFLRATKEVPLVVLDTTDIIPEPTSFDAVNIGIPVSVDPKAPVAVRNSTL
jgi:hypothetical protein